MDSSGLKKRMRERVHDGADVSKLAKLIFTIGFLQIIVTAYNAITGVMRGAPGTSLLLAASAGVGAVVAMLGALALERTYREKEETQETIAELEDFNRYAGAPSATTSKITFRCSQRCWIWRSTPRRATICPKSAAICRRWARPCAPCSRL